MDVLGLSAPDELKLTTAISKVKSASSTLSLKELKALKAGFLKVVQELKAEWRKDVRSATRYIDERIAPPNQGTSGGWNHAELSD